jgi:hypothetical protein
MPVFKTGAINHSATSPDKRVGYSGTILDYIYVTQVYGQCSSAKVADESAIKVP